MRKVELSSQSALGRRLPIRSQLVEVTLALNGDLGFPVPRDENLQAIGGLPVVMNTRHLQLQIATLAMKRITDNIPESSSFGTVNSELTASDTLLLRKRKRRPC